MWTDYGVLIKKHSLFKKVLLAIPRATRQNVRKIIDQLLPYPVEVLTVPDLTISLTGKAKSQWTADVAVDDYLGRDVVEPKFTTDASKYLLAKFGDWWWLLEDL